MDSCVSLHRNPDSAIELRLSTGTKTKKILIPSTTKEKLINFERPIDELGFKSTLPMTNRRDIGSKEEIFFDTQVRLDSDCDYEDDFFSINGDFTPAHGNTPVHPSSFIEIPRYNRSHFTDGAPDHKTEPSIDKKKKLSELFKESSWNDHGDGGQNVAVSHDNGNGTPCLSRENSICNSERTPNTYLKTDKEESIKATQCCLPRLVTSLSCNDRKKRLATSSEGGG